MEKNRLSKQELVLLLFMLCCYAASVYFIVQNNPALLLVFFILHSILCLSFFFLQQERITNSLLDEADSSSFNDEMRLLKKNEFEISSLKKEKEDLLVKNEQLQSDNRQLTQENEQLKQDAVTPPSVPVSDSHPLLPSEENPVTLDLICTLSQIMDEMRKYSSPCGIQLVLSTSCKSLPIKADASFLRIMFRNIIDNSIKYMKRNGSLVITVSNIGDDLFIVLKDNGEGLSSDETQHIFELNYQGSNRISGNGLGLTQAKSIVEYYGGTIYAKSGQNKGMAIYIQLPMGTR